MSESQIRALFTEIADGEPARSQVDIQLARRRGRARLRRRRASVAGTSALAAAAVVILAMGVGPVRLGSGPAAGGRQAARQHRASSIRWSPTCRSAGCPRVSGWWQATRARRWGPWSRGAT